MCKSVSYIDKRVILRYFCEITQPLLPKVKQRFVDFLAMV